MEDKDLKVKFSGLKDGEHHFNMLVGKAFFTSCQSDLLNEGEVKINLTFIKQPTHFKLDFELNGWILSNCDRCATEFHQPIDSNFSMVVKLGEEFEEVDPEMVIIPRSEFELDVSQWIFEYLVLSMPAKRICEEQVEGLKCDEEVIERLNSGNKKVDNPVWDALKGLKDSNTSNN